tara:strand:- start:206 stop:394 length:189 start_codon:yes stop_codon:yes gene_type:complete
MEASMGFNIPIIFPLIILVWLLLPITAAFLAKNRNQSMFLWFFLTLIFPIAIIFIAMKDKSI